MARKRKKRHQGDVELNLAAMLDMAFQLLTFFILTFKPAPVEGQVQLRLPLPSAVTAAAGSKAGSDESNKDVLKGLTTLVISVLGRPDGSIQQMAVGTTAVGTLPALDNKLHSLLGDEGTGFDQVIIQVGSNLHYNELMKVVDVCTRQKLPNGERLAKLSFVELPEEGI